MTFNCSNCKANSCYQGNGCAKGYEFGGIREKAVAAYEDEETRKILVTAGRIEAEHYMQWTRLEEITAFAEMMGYKTIGIAMCIGLSAEADILKKFLSEKFTVHSVCCKNSEISKDDYEIPHVKQDRYEATCNPVGQALLFNELKTDLNIIVGLCVGHDILFTQHSDAPCTTFIVKDRVLAHNPAAVLYNRYYRNKLGIK